MAGLTAEEIRVRLPELERAIASGAKSVVYQWQGGERRLDYQTTKDLIAARDDMLRRLAEIETPGAGGVVFASARFLA